MKTKIIGLLLFTLLTFSLQAQMSFYEVDSSDHFLTRINKQFVNYYLGEGDPKPTRSVLLSIIVPGAGQIYNRQAWKLPAIYGGYGALIYTLSFNRDLHQRLDKAYRLSVAGEDHEFSNLNQSTLRSFRDQYRRNVELTYIGMGAVYVITLLDAFVSAHLSTFDVSEDLSLFLPQGSPAAPLNIGIAYKF